MASKGAKLLQLFSIKRKGSSKTSPDENISEQDVEEGSYRRERTKDGGIVPARHGQSSVDQLEEELLNLRQSLERKEAEMQKLNTEVSTLRIMTSISSVQPEPQSQELPVSQEETSQNVNGADFFRSEASQSQLSCLDFSLASTGNLKLEGKIKTEDALEKEIQSPGVKVWSNYIDNFGHSVPLLRTKITPGLKRVDQTGSILSNTAMVSAPGPEQKRSESNDASTLEDRSTTKGTVPSHVQGLDIVHKLVGVTKIRVKESTTEISKPQYVGKYCQDHFGGDLTFPEPVGGLDICSRSYICETDDERFDLDAHQSRSPPKSPSSTEEQDDFEFPSPGAEMYLDSNKFFTPQTADSLKVASLVVAAAAGPKSSCALADLQVDEKSLVVDMKDHEEMEEKASKIPVDDEAKNSLKVLTSSTPKGFSKEHGQTIVMPSSEVESNSLVGMENPLKVETGLKVASNSRYTSRSQVESLAEESPLKAISKVTQQAVAAASRHASMDLDRVLDEKSLNTELRFLDLDYNKLSKAMKSFRRVDSSTSSTHPDRISRSASMLPLPRSPPAAPQAAPHGVRSQSLESQTKARNFLEQSKTSKSLTWNRNERDLESKAVTVWRSDRQAETMANSNSFDIENLPPLPSHGKNSYGARNNEYPTTTGDRHEGLSPPVSASVSPSARNLSPSRYSVGSELLHDEPGWRVKSSGSEPFPRTFSHMNRESSFEETDLEEEVRRCLEKSRLLLMSDATSSDDKYNVPVSPVSREASFSVLALSRHRRSMEKNRSSVGSIPEIQKKEQEWSEPQEHLAIVSYVDDNTLNIQTRKIDDYAKVEARRRIDDNSIVSLQRLNNAVIAYDKKYAQPACVPEALDNKLGSPPPLPRRSRFFEEANSPRF